jgi:hypothetical protein
VAQKIQILLIDALDVSAAEGTDRFGLDGTEYEIDLNAGHAKNCAMRWPGTSVLTTGPTAAPASQPVAAAAAGRRPEHHRDPRVARAQGIEVKDRGRIPAGLVAQFKAAAGQQG